MPYPRIHITNVRGHGIPPCPLCVFPPGGACSPHGMHGTHRSLGCVYCPQNTLRRVWHTCHTHAALCQSSHRIHRIHRNFWRRIFSHGFRRCSQIRRVWHPCHTHATLCQSSHGIHRIHRSFWRRIFSHGFHRCPQIRRVWHPCHTHATLCQSSHGIHRIHRNFWRRRASHGFRRCPQMVRLRKVLWLLWEDSLVSAWVWQDAIPSYNCTDWGLKFCVFCAIRGRISQKEISVRICVICGRISQQEVSVNSVNSVGGCSGCLVGAVETTAPPGRVRWYGRGAIPSYNCTYWGLKFCVFCAIRGRISQ